MAYSTNWFQEPLTISEGYKPAKLDFKIRIGQPKPAIFIPSDDNLDDLRRLWNNYATGTTGTYYHAYTATT